MVADLQRDQRAQDLQRQERLLGHLRELDLPHRHRAQLRCADAERAVRRAGVQDGSDRLRRLAPVPRHWRILAHPGRLHALPPPRGVRRAAPQGAREEGGGRGGRRGACSHPGPQRAALRRAWVLFLPPRAPTRVRASMCVRERMRVYGRMCVRVRRRGARVNAARRGRPTHRDTRCCWASGVASFFCSTWAARGRGPPVCAAPALRGRNSGSRGPRVGVIAARICCTCHLDFCVRGRGAARTLGALGNGSLGLRGRCLCAWRAQRFCASCGCCCLLLCTHGEFPAPFAPTLGFNE
mmetsp:Transcript_26903/g.66293  ORF Transcript_26903/g.66293 Transcript_26903/m.66293 type:complete len:296 (-) Transcript_26903:19-906(-)